MSLGPALRPILDSWQVSLVSVSEVDVSVDSRASWAAEWKRHGWHVQLSTPEHGVCRVALLSRLPFKAVKVCEAEGLTRHAAALVDLQVAGRTEVVLCVAAYLQSGQPDRAEAQAKDLLVSADYCGRPSLLFGDWNTTQEEGFIAEALQRGMVHACDTAARGEALPPTGPPRLGTSRRRRIDYGLTLRDFVATEVLHVPEVEIGALSDHRVVVYQFEGDAPDSLTTPPRRHTPHPDPCEEDFVFPGEAEARFRAHLAEDLDGAWSYLSDWAEHLLFEPAQGAQVPRSQLWDPVRPRRRRDTDHELDQSPGLRGVRRLLRKLQVCAHRPWDGALTSKCQAACGKARAFFPDLPRLHCGSLEAAQLVQQLVAKRASVNVTFTCNGGKSAWTKTWAPFAPMSSAELQSSWPGSRSRLTCSKLLVVGTLRSPCVSRPRCGLQPGRGLSQAIPTRSMRSCAMCRALLLSILS